MAKSKSKAAKELSKLGAAKGGRARASALTPAERSEIARNAVLKRWEKAGKTPLPQATHAGVLEIGDIAFDCAVLDNGERVISETKFMQAMGMYRSGALSRRRQVGDDGAQSPLFLAYKNLKPFIAQHLSGVHDQLVEYRSQSGSPSRGIKAELLPKICEMWLDARNAGVLGSRQNLIAAKADVLLRGLATVGIIALIDEATGFQEDRERNALASILEAYVAKELRPWVRTFPAEYYRQVYRLLGWEYPPEKNKMPSYVGKLTTDVVYSRLPYGVLDELKRLTPRDEKGRLKTHYHRRLSEDVGHPKLREHLGAVVALMRISKDKDWDGFYRLLNQYYPRTTPSLPLWERAGAEPY